MERQRSPLLAQLGDRLQVELTTADADSGLGQDVERLVLVIVPDEGADFNHGFLGQSTPLAQALLGQPAGATIEYRRGDIIAARLLNITPTGEPPPTEEIARQREETVRQALEQAQRTDAIVFASSFSGKWGDYDPGGIEHWDGKS